MVKVLFSLPLRQTTGMVTSILKMAGLDWPVPDLSTLSRRQKTLAVQIRHRPARGPGPGPGPGPVSLLVNSTGIKLLGSRGTVAPVGPRKPNERVWLARKHGTHRRRQYRKVHLAMDRANGDIRAVEFTSSREGDSPVLPDLLDQIPADEQVGTVTGDGASDTRRCHSVIVDRGGTAIISIRKNGRLWKENGPAARTRNDILRASKRFGRANWKHWFGYHAQSRIEAKIHCLKSFGERIGSRDPDRQTAEIHLHVALINRFNVRGTAKTERVA